MIVYHVIYDRVQYLNKYWPTLRFNSLASKAELIKLLNNYHTNIHTHNDKGDEIPLQPAAVL